jgi:hypothetical protein
MPNPKDNSHLTLFPNIRLSSLSLFLSLLLVSEVTYNHSSNGILHNNIIRRVTAKDTSLRFDRKTQTPSFEEKQNLTQENLNSTYHDEALQESPSSQGLLQGKEQR